MSTVCIALGMAPLLARGTSGIPDPSGHTGWRVRRHKPSQTALNRVNRASGCLLRRQTKARRHDALWAGPPVAALRTLYGKSQAHKSSNLAVSPVHTLHYEVHGNPNGQPVLCVHGGPGAGAYANHARFFDPKHWRIILVDQRGCGASTPRGCLEDNTTQALIQDFEVLREKLRIENWVLFGGSWGTALSLAYAQRHTHRVQGLILRAICTMSPPELDWMYRGGVAALQPKAWTDFLAPLSEAERADPLLSYHARLTSSDPAIRNKAAAAWLSYDMAAGKLPSEALQAWDGSAWNSSEKGNGKRHHLPALKPPGNLQASTATNRPNGTYPSMSGSSNGSGVSSTSRSGGSSGGGSTAANAIADGSNVSPPAPWQPQTGFGAGASGDKPKRKPGRPRNSEGPTSLDRTTVPPPSGTVPSAKASSSGAPQSASFFGSSDGISHFTAQAMLTAHYSANGAFLLDQPILADVDKLRGIPAIGIQGRMDLVCPPVTAFQLHKAWPELRLRLVGGAGHSQYDDAITHELLEATDAMRDRSFRPQAPELQVAVY